MIGPTNTIWPWFLMLHQALPPQSSHGSCVFQPCMHTGWLLETSSWDHYWWKYEGGQWLVFWWFWGWGTSDTHLSRWKLGKKNTLQSWWPPLPYGHHGAHSPAPPHTTISQHAVWQFYVIKTRKYYCFYYLLAFLRHNASLTCPACVCWLWMMKTHAPNWLNQ